MHTNPRRPLTSAIVATVLTTASVLPACAGPADPGNPFGSSSPSPTNPHEDTEPGTTGQDDVVTTSDVDTGIASVTMTTDDSSPLDDTGPTASSGPEPTTGPVGETSAAPDQTSGDDCECNSGDCCDGCHYWPSTEICQAQADTQYDCAWGTACGTDVGVRHRDRYCSGASSSCDGDLGPWSAFQVADGCSDEQTCSPGDSSCNDDLDCICTYYVVANECPGYTSANGTGAGGGELFEICGTIDLVTGFVTIDAEKYNGTTFGDRPYQVRVSNPGDSSCGPDTSYFVVSDSNPSGIGTSSLTFDFQSQWLAGQTEKAYCVTASTQPGDTGYDPFSAQQTSWWWSDKIVVERVCP